MEKFVRFVKNIYMEDEMPQELKNDIMAYRFLKRQESELDEIRHEMIRYPKEFQITEGTIEALKLLEAAISKIREEIRILRTRLEKKES